MGYSDERGVSCRGSGSRTFMRCEELGVELLHIDVRWSDYLPGNTSVPNMTHVSGNNV